MNDYNHFDYQPRSQLKVGHYQRQRMLKRHLLSIILNHPFAIGDLEWFIFIFPWILRMDNLKLFFSYFPMKTLDFSILSRKEDPKKEDNLDSILIWYDGHKRTNQNGNHLLTISDILDPCMQTVLAFYFWWTIYENFDKTIKKH